MTTAERKGIDAEINVTPMIDVLLVLLIVFMVIVPALPRGETAQALHPEKNRSRRGPDTVVLEVMKDTAGHVALRINQQAIAQENLATRLASIYANRAERVLFLKADGQLSFTQVAEVIDIGHAAGVDRVGLMTPKVLAAQ